MRMQLHPTGNSEKHSKIVDNDFSLRPTGFSHACKLIKIGYSGVIVIFFFMLMLNIIRLKGTSRFAQIGQPVC